MAQEENNRDCKPEDDKLDRIKKHIDEADGVDRGFAQKHPFLKKALKGIGIGIGVAAAIVIKVVTSNSKSSGGYDGNSTGDGSKKRNYPEERSSPREHNVSGYDRQRYGKTEHVNPYSRGGHKDKA